MTDLDSVPLLEWLRCLELDCKAQWREGGLRRESYLTQAHCYERVRKHIEEELRLRPGEKA